MTRSSKKTITCYGGLDDVEKIAPWKTQGVICARLLFISLFFILSSCACTSKTDSKISAPPEEASLSILQNPGIEHFKSMMLLVIQDQMPDATTPQHFFVTKYKDANSTMFVFWKEGHLLWMLTPGDETEESWLSVRYPSGGRLLDLHTDVVPDGSVGSSTYLVSQSWTSERIYDAVVNGDLITLTPNKNSIEK